MVQRKSVYCTGQECPWFRERVSMVQGKKDRILINCNLPVHNPDTQIRPKSCMIQNLTYGSARGAPSNGCVYLDYILEKSVPLMYDNNRRTESSISCYNEETWAW